MKRKFESSTTKTEQLSGDRSISTKKPKSVEGMETDSEKKFEKRPKKTGKIKGFSKVDRKQNLFDKIKDAQGKPNWIEIKKQKTELRLKRLKSKPLYEMNLEVKKMWEQLRNHNVKKDVKDKVVVKMHDLLKTNYQNIIHSHDMTRTVQSLLKYGSATIRNEICAELLPHIVRISTSKYASFCMKKLFLYSTPQNRAKIVDAMCGNVERLLNHTIGTKALELAYSTWATKNQKLKMRQELYGKLAKLEREEDASCLDDLFNKAPNLKPAILSATKCIVYKALTKQHILVSSLLHCVLLDYFNHCDENGKTELIDSLCESVMQLLTSREGSIMAMKIVWLGTNKIKKTVVKTLKGKVKEVSELENGHLLLLAVFDAVDDTVLIKKALIPELLENIEAISADEIGRRVLLHLTAHWDQAYFHPEEINLLRQGCSGGTSKKDPEIKTKELLEAVIDPLLNFVAQNPAHFLASPSIAMLMLAILKAGQGDSLTSAQKAVATLIADPDKKNLIEDPGLHIALKKLVQNDKNCHSAGKSTFSSAITQALTDTVLLDWIKINRACFILITILESADEDSVASLKQRFSKNILKTLSKQTSKGSQILYKKIV
ncbi:protein penguin [Nilaparvata lugens]|uniref:protein penguin n=1 Tax=Nilaparvata lugens TaxID=108931 RepID=UPI00193DD121|nr:protein penguin [Nilaparvata lugens]